MPKATLGGLIGIINSMTPGRAAQPEADRSEPPQPHRRGAGVPASEVNNLVKQFDSMAPIMKTMAESREWPGGCRRSASCSRVACWIPAKGGCRAEEGNGKAAHPEGASQD